MKFEDKASVAKLQYYVGIVQLIRLLTIFFVLNSPLWPLCKTELKFIGYQKIKIHIRY